MRAEMAPAAASVWSNACREVDMYKPCACQRAIHAPSRRFFLAGLAAAAIAPTGVHAQAGGPASVEDMRFMRMALDEARQADFPFGAVIVRDGAVIARGRNLGRTTDDPTAHGEMVAGAASPITAARRCAAARSTPPANRVRCAWARSSGAMWGGSFSRRRLRNSPPR